MIANSVFLDHSPRAHVSYEKWISDHYPIVCTWSAKALHSSLQWRWPKPMVKKQATKEVEWPTQTRTTYVQWTKKEVAWIAASTESIPQQKVGLATTTCDADCPPFFDHTYAVHSGPQRLRFQWRSRTRLRIAASIAILFRVCFKGVLNTIAPLSRG